MCPACGESLVTFELKGIEIDQCQACGGIWLDSGEVDEILERAGRSLADLRELVKAGGESSGGKRTCVRCRARLGSLLYRGVDLDRCPYGHGVWFDKGELAAVVKQGGGPGNAIEAVLGEMFGAFLAGGP